MSRAEGRLLATGAQVPRKVEPTNAVAHPSRVTTLRRVSIAARRTLALGASVLFVVGCASACTVGRSPVTTGASSSVGHPAATGPGTADRTPCIDPDPATPRPVQPAVPGVSADGNIATSWSLDNAITVAPAAGATPVISRQRALCVLLAASDIRGSGLLGDALTLILGKVTVSDAPVAAPDPIDPGLPALTAFHSRLAWIAVIDPSILAACPTQPPVSSSGSAAGGDTSPTVPIPQVVPYQLVVLDAATGTDGLVYGARTNDPCSDSLAGPYVRPMVVTVSVPWRLISRDPGGLFDTIALAVRTCDDVSEYEGAYATDAGVVEFDVRRPIANCGTSRESVQTLHGPGENDPPASTLTHAATGFSDTTSPGCIALCRSVFPPAVG